MRNFIVAFLLGIFLLAGCATSSDPRLALIERVTIACENYGGVLDNLATYRQAGLLTPEQIAKVDVYEPFLTAACLADPSTLTTNALNDILDLSMFLLVIEGDAK